MMAESGTFAGTVNANGGVRVPLPATAQEADVYKRQSLCGISFQSASRRVSRSATEISRQACSCMAEPARCT